MLTLVLPEREFWDENKERFFTVTSKTLKLEHSLISISKWEAKYKVPFLSKNNKSNAQTLDYIRFMTVNNVDEIAYAMLQGDDINKIGEYIKDPMSATTITYLDKGSTNHETYTSELIYFYMFSFGIPIECEKWHLNRLLKLIEVFGEKNKPNKKLSHSEIAARNRALNAARRKKINSKG